MRIRGIESTDLFAGTRERPLQVVRVRLDAGPSVASVRVEGAGVSTPEPVVVDHGAEVVEIPVAMSVPCIEGATRPITVIAETVEERTEAPSEIVTAAPGWTVYMVPHFHYDPVWWNTQGGYMETWPLRNVDGDPPEVRTAFELVRLHLDAARADSDYKFVLAEVDYLKPYFDVHPEDRADLRCLIAEGRVEIVGGSYNQPNTNLTAIETTIRNLVYGIGFQRDVLGGDPRTAWMLDVFGHDPAYPSLMADAGLTSSAWARGPYHQWGPQRIVGDNLRMQFSSEFEWISPTGRGLLTSYMPSRYTAGLATQQASTLDEAMAEAYAQFRMLKPVAATRNVLLPVGGDHTVPSRWATQMQRRQAARYVWPRLLVGLPREFFAAVREEAARERVCFTPQTRDMNPVYPGKDVSYIDTKQAQRATEAVVLDAECLATLAALLGAQYPAQALDKAWRQLLFNAHHDAITGTASDQVYLDLLAGWREAYDLGEAARRDAGRRLAGHVDTRGDGQALVVFNTLPRARSGLVRYRREYGHPGQARGIEFRNHAGEPVRTVAESVRRYEDGSLAEISVTFRADEVPSLGYRIYRELPAADCPRGWASTAGAAIENEAFLVQADPRRGGALARLVDKRTGKELLQPSTLGNELVVQEEYSAHPRWARGPWLLLPKGPGRTPADQPARVQVETCAIGRRLVVTYALDDLRVRQETVLWDGADRIEFRTHVDGSIGSDQLLRVAFPIDVRGALPIYEVGNAIIGRSFGTPNADAKPHAFTLDNPASTWFGLGSTVRVALTDDDTTVRVRYAVGVAEVIVPDARCEEAVRELVVRLVAQGVTATVTRSGGPRYGALDLDSNLPDVRIVLGGPDHNAFAEQVLGRASPAYDVRLHVLMNEHGRGRLWVPGAKPRKQMFGPSADVRGPRDLPVLIVFGRSLDAEIRALAADLEDATVEIVQPKALDGSDEPLEDYAVALLNRGTPGCVATPDGTLYINLMRSCTGWPAGEWVDAPRRTLPDGSSFAWQHWSHTFEYALQAGRGDWRRAEFVAAGQSYNRELLVTATHAHDGTLPPEASLLSVTPESVALTAFKPRHNLSASGLIEPPDPYQNGLAFRVYESRGRPEPAMIRLFTGLKDAYVTDLLEERERTSAPIQDQAIVFDVAPTDTVTLTARPARDFRATMQVAVPLIERAQPVFTRYWLHGRGAAPIGYLTASVHLTPTRLTLAGLDDAASLRLTVTSGLHHSIPGSVELDVPPELAVEPPGPLLQSILPGEHRAWDLMARIRPGAPAGRYYLAARIRDGLGQTLEDVVEVVVGAAGQDEPLLVTAGPGSLRLAPGEQGMIWLRLRNRARGEIRGEAQLLSPYGSWEMVDDVDRGFVMAPGNELRTWFVVRAPADARPGSHWWALTKIMYFGRVHYTRPITVEVVINNSTLHRRTTRRRSHEEP